MIALHDLVAWRFQTSRAGCRCGRRSAMCGRRDPRFRVQSMLGYCATRNYTSLVLGDNTCCTQEVRPPRKNLEELESVCLTRRS